MSKRLTKVLSLVLTLVMFLSVSTPAFALGGGGGLGKGWDRDIGEEDVRDFEPEGEITVEEELDYFQTLDEETGVQVTVEAPLGALPTLAELKFEPVEAEDILDQFGVSAEEAPEILLALDISFWLNGIEIEPEEPVRVKISAPELEGREDLNVIHIPDEAEPEVVELLDEEDLSFALGTNEIAFVADSFSTYAVTGRNRTATIHYGYIGSNGFVEFPNNSSTSTSYPSGNISSGDVLNGDDYTFLIYDFEGYKYKETRLSSTNGTQIWPVLQAQSYYVIYSRFHYETFNDTNPDFDDELANNANIYVIYEPLTVTQGSSGSGESGGGDVDAPDLPASKDVNPNGDGTYDITLSVTGVEVSQEKTKRASVIVIFDRSGSMNNEMDGTNHNGGNNSWSGQTVASINAAARLSIAGKAVIALAEELLDKKDSQGNPLVQMSLITFSDTANVIKFGADNDTYTTDKSAYVSAVNAITASGATNWEAALNEANALEVSTDAPTYVIFVSDGDPTYRISRMNDSDDVMHDTAQANNAGTFGWHNYRTGVIGTGNLFRQAHYDAAKRVAQSIVTHAKKFYTIGVSSQGTRMNTLATDAYATSGGIPAGETHYFPGNSQSELKEAFDAIATAVSEDFGFTEVTIDDGVTEMTTVETDALTGTPENFVYRKGTNQDDPSQNPVWTGEGVPEATITADNHVIWDTSKIGSLEAGVTYSVTFTVWPSQESYDIIADINNGIIRNADGSINRIGTPAEAYAAQPPEVQKQIVIVGNVYTLLTNTGVNLSYKFNGTEGSNTVTVKKEGSMPLDTSYFGVTKVWNNGIDMRTANALTVTVGEGEEAKTYIVDKDGDFILDDGGNPIEYDRSNPDPRTIFYVDLIVTEGKGEDQEDYTEIRLTSQDNWVWDQMFIAPGVITHDKTATSGALTIRETGRDYSVREKPGESYYWNLSAEVYHPMVINGEAVVLQLVDEDDTSAPDLAKNTFQGNYYNVDGEIFKKLGSADSALITAINDRRSMLYVTKEVENAEGAEAPEDALFSYEITLDSPNDPHPEDEDYDDYYNTFWFAIQTDPEDRTTVVKDDEDIVVDGATPEDGNTGFYWFDNGGTVTVSIKAGQYIVFTNLPLGTDYTVTELDGADMPEGFIFTEAEPDAVPNLEGFNPTPGEVDEKNPMKVTGNIDASNSDYSVTYTNTYLGYFYVYHSSDNTIERYPMAVDGVAYSQDNTFDITALTKEGSLYGGYYQDYGQKGSFEIAEITSFPYEDKDGTPYEGKVGTWTLDLAYTESGLTMVPVTSTVYYLKEVPETKYLKPYMHYTYKIGDGDIADGWLISDVDDLNYQETGFVITTENEAKVCQSLSVTNSKNGNTVKLTAKRVFTADGFLTYLTVMKDYAPVEATAFAANCTVLEYWVTPDGLIVTGIMQRVFGTIDNYNTIASSAADTEIPSTIAVFGAGDGDLPLDP